MVLPQSAPHHQLAVHQQLGPLRLDVDLTFSAPWTLIFGPSGSGKSSLLRAACGLLDHNGVEFARRDTAGQWLSRNPSAPHRRSLSYAPQTSTLFPHLPISENVTF